MSQNDYIQFTIHQLIETWNQLSNCITKHPEKLIENQKNYWQSYFTLCKEIGLQNKQFNISDWQENMSLYFIKRSYLLLSEHINNMVKNITEDTDIKIANKIKFHTNQFVDAMSPTHFAHLNPEVLSKTLESNGMNLMIGMNQFFEDLE